MSILNTVRGWHRPMVIATGFMAGLVVISLVGLAVDDRAILGESVWIKPLKFGFAFAVYGATLAWLLTLLRKGRRFGWWTGTVFAVLTVVEVGTVAFAGARGTFSHFNTSDDPVNQISQDVFGYGIPFMFLANVVIAVMVLFQRAGARPIAWAIRFGLALSSAGMFMAFWLVGYGGRDERHLTDGNGDSVRMTVGHGIGDTDGNGMPITNWSTTGGDLRVPHFIGLHGIHVLLLVAVALAALAGRRAWLRDERVRARLMVVLGGGYAGVFSLVSWQAMRGQALIHPDAATLLVFGTIALLTVATAAVVVVLARRRFVTVVPQHVAEAEMRCSPPAQPGTVADRR